MNNKKVSNYGSISFVSMLVVMMGSMFISNAVHAGDRKIFSGAACQAYFSSGVNNLRHTTTGVYNTSSASQWITCAVTRDNTTNSNGIHFSRVYVRGSGSFYCRLDNPNNNGTVGRSAWGTRSSTGYMSIKLSSSVSLTPYVYICRLPANSNLVSIVLDEY